MTEENLYWKTKGGNTSKIITHPNDSPFTSNIPLGGEMVLVTDTILLDMQVSNLFKIIINIIF